jgi:hypothetical protein
MALFPRGLALWARASAETPGPDRKPGRGFGLSWPLRFANTPGNPPSVLNAIAATNHSKVPMRIFWSMNSPTNPRAMQSRARIVQIRVITSSRQLPISHGNQPPDPGAERIETTAFARGHSSVP